MNYHSYNHFAWRGNDPEPFEKKEWILLALGASLLLLVPIVPTILGFIFGFIGFASLYLLFCGLVVLYKTPSRWEERKGEMTKNLPRNFVIISGSALLILVLLCAII